MPKYRVRVERHLFRAEDAVTAHCEVEVEADSEAEAIARAREEAEADWRRSIIEHTETKVIAIDGERTAKKPPRH